MKLSLAILIVSLRTTGCDLYDTEVPDENIEIWCATVDANPCDNDAAYLTCVESGTQMYEATEASSPDCLPALQTLLECLGDCEPTCQDDRSHCDACDDDLDQYNNCIGE